MRLAVTITLLTLAAVGTGQDGDKGKAVSRYGIDPDSKTYPQSTPKDALGSVLKAIGEKQFDYLLAHLADPMFVDQHVAKYMAQMGPGLTESQKRSQAFDRLAKATAERFKEDPSKLTELQRFYKDGEWDEAGNAAVAKLKDLQARKVFMTKIPPDRWVLLDREK